MTGTRRQQSFRKTLRVLAPLIPYADAEAVMESAGKAKMKALPPSVALWLALTSHVRHNHTDYDALLEEGYDRQAARHFVLGDTEDVLTSWGCSRAVADEAVEELAEEGSPPSFRRSPAS